MSIRRFDNEMNVLNLDIIRMGGLIENAIENTKNALTSRDIEKAHTVIASDKDISALAAKIESEALHILLLEHPVAGDLRTVSTALKIVTDMERIADQSSDICDIIISLNEFDYQNDLSFIPEMASIASDMVRTSVDAFVDKNLDLASKTIEMDDEVDKLFFKVRDVMIDIIKADSKKANHAVYLMMIAKYLEKIGDHAENIANWLHFNLTGEKKNVKLI